jgi:hypothetical protein
MGSRISICRSSVLNEIKVRRRRHCWAVSVSELINDDRPKLLVNATDRFFNLFISLVDKVCEEGGNL